MRMMGEMVGTQIDPEVFVALQRTVAKLEPIMVPSKTEERPPAGRQAA
jgi:hypothetical protein